MLLNTEVNFVQILNEYILSASNYWLCQLQRLIVLVPREIAHDTVIVKNVLGIIRKRMNGLTARGKTVLVKPCEIEYQKKRQKIQVHFWDIVGAVEHISLPKLEDVVKKEFNCEDDRFVHTQIKLMQTEGRIRLQSNVKVWIRQPADSAEF